MIHNVFHNVFSIYLVSLSIYLFFIIYCFQAEKLVIASGVAVATLRCRAFAKRASTKVPKAACPVAPPG